MEELVEDWFEIVEPTDRPPARRRGWRWWVNWTGRILFTLGLLVLGFVAYQLWGTGIEHARAQSSLEKQFDEQLSTTVAPATTVASTVPPTTVASAPATTAAPVTTAPAATPPRPNFANGDPVARLEIPRMGLDEIVVAGVGIDDLKQGPGHYPQTPLPGERGNAAIAGHRTTYGAPFLDIDNLQPGDDIVATTYAGRFVYKVTGTVIVPPSEVSVLDNTADDRLTLTSCDPKYSATNRIIVTASFDPTQSSPIVTVAPGDATTTPDTTPADVSPDGPVVSSAVVTTVVSGVAPTTAVGGGAGTATTAVGATETTVGAAVVGTAAPAAPPTSVAPSPGLSVDDSFQRGWFDDASAWPQVLAWGLAGIAVAVAAWWLGRRTRRWIGWVAVVAPLLVMLYFFYENVNRLLPPNI